MCTYTLTSTFQSISAIFIEICIDLYSRSPNSADCDNLFTCKLVPQLRLDLNEYVVSEYYA